MPNKKLTQFLLLPELELLDFFHKADARVIKAIRTLPQDNLNYT